MAKQARNERQVFMITAAKRHGKSTLVRQVAETIAKETGNILVFKEGSKLNDPAFKGYPVTPIGKYAGGKAIINGGDIEYQKFLWLVYRHYRNGVLVIDDAAHYEDNNPTPPMKRILIDCRHLGIDVILVFHSLADTPIKLFAYTDVLILGYTSGNFKYKVSKLPEAEEILKKAERIARTVKSCKCEPGPPCKCGKRYYREVIKLS